MPPISFEDFRLFSCQATLFTPDEEVSSGKLLRVLLQEREWAERFDADPVALPIPSAIVSIGRQGADPRVIPKLIFESKDPGVWRCEISSARINFFWRQRKPELQAVDLSTFLRDASQFLVKYKETSGARVGRIAAVLNRYVAHSEPGRFLADHFCQKRWLDAPFDRPSDFELHARKRYVLAEKFQLNSWVRCKSATLSLGDESESIILLEQDLNTVPEDAMDRDFSTNQIEDFFSSVEVELEEILKLYYPPKE